MRTVDSATNVIVEDIADPSLVAEVRAGVLAVFRELNVPSGAWMVALVASDTRGRWDVGIRGPKGSHFVSFAALPNQIAPVAAAHVRRTLSRLTAKDLSS